MEIRSGSSGECEPQKVDENQTSNACATARPTGSGALNDKFEKMAPSLAFQVMSRPTHNCNITETPKIKPAAVPLGGRRSR